MFIIAIIASLLRMAVTYLAFFALTIFAVLASVHSMLGRVTNACATTQARVLRKGSTDGRAFVSKR
jgi:hypothetical protein